MSKISLNGAEIIVDPSFATRQNSKLRFHYARYMIVTSQSDAEAVFDALRKAGIEANVQVIHYQDYFNFVQQCHREAEKK